MFDDVSALFTVSVYVEAMLGLLLLFAWVQDTNVRAVAWWGNAHLLRAGSITLFGMYGRFPDVITIDIANSILLTSFAVTWIGTRLFGEHKPNFAFMFGGAIIWLIACQMPDIADSVAKRALLSAAIIAAYTWLAAAELWGNNKRQLVARLPAIFLLFAHGALFLLRPPLGMLMPQPVGTERLFGSVWLTVLSSEELLFTIAIAFILMAMAFEHTAYLHKAAAFLDPLTGIWNRRGLIIENDRLMNASGKNTEDTAVLLIELDNFREITQRYGRALGDQVLQIIAATAKTTIGSSDFVGRVGGEEFAVVLYDAPRDRALTIAERIRSAFAEEAAAIAGYEVGATVSIGLVQHEGPMVALTELLWKANLALLRAKERGSNLVELVAPEYLSRRKNVPLPAS
jgi:diguanylate cyclase (GGDEF)-like protein